ncbi:MAG: BrnA antitoxin family protein, partial [Patescibacteria group bacterium]
TKTPVSIRLDDDVLAFFKSKGAGWQTRISDALRAIMNAAQ